MIFLTKVDAALRPVALGQRPIERLNEEILRVDIAVVDHLRPGERESVFPSYEEMRATEAEWHMDEDVAPNMKDARKAIATTLGVDFDTPIVDINRTRRKQPQPTGVRVYQTQWDGVFLEDLIYSSDMPISDDAMGRYITAMWSLVSTARLPRDVKNRFARGLVGSLQF